MYRGRGIEIDLATREATDMLWRDVARARGEIRASNEGAKAIRDWLGSKTKKPFNNMKEMTSVMSGLDKKLNEIKVEIATKQHTETSNKKLEEELQAVKIRGSFSFSSTRRYEKKN
ncbi:hypothetical protein EVAR_5107_1 [Eumeta japonica]|uniref:Uncharacterized protein n=1 Tax=Eumeta variegata TaxID=151549 RepID=A0A4C1SXR0_EUMVA|nr:hypothetical protein EVAR_5107_1 [Eumeta japonica]